MVIEISETKKKSMTSYFSFSYMIIVKMLIILFTSL